MPFMSPLYTGLDLSNTGIPTQSQLWMMYSRFDSTLLFPQEIESLWPFYLAFLFFKNTVIVQGVAQRAAVGVASSSKADKVASLLPRMIHLVESFLTKQQAVGDESLVGEKVIENRASLYSRL